MRKNSLWSSLLISAIALTAMVGCGGSSSNTPASGAVVQFYYVADTLNHRIVRFESFASPTGFSDYYLPVTKGVLPTPTDIAFDSASNYYIVDQASNSVGFLSYDFTSGWTPFYGPSGSPFNKPTGVAVDGLNRIYVADTGNHRIVRMDDIYGTNLVTYPPAGVASPFVAPYNVRVDSNYNIYVSDPKQNAVFEMGNMSGTGLTVLKLFTSGKSATFNNPQGIEVDFQNKLYVADTGNNRIVRFGNITGGAEQEWDSGGVTSNLTGLTVLGRDQILMTDTGHNRIYRILDITGSSPSYYGSYGTGTDQLNGPLSVRAH